MHSLVLIQPTTRSVTTTLHWKADRAEEEVGRGVESHEYSLPQKEAEGEAAVETVPLFTGAAEQVASQGEERPARAGDSCTQTVTQG